MERIDEINRIYGNIRDIEDKIDDLIKLITSKQSIDRKKRLKSVNDNTGLILSKKITEIEKIFKENNVDFYDETILKFIIEADLMKIANNALNEIREYFLDLNIYEDQKIRNLSFFNKKNKKNDSEDKNTIDRLNNKLKKYESLNESIKKYILEDDLLDSIIKFIESKGHTWYRKNIGDITQIEDELDKIGFSDIVIKLEKTIKDKGYIDILPNNNIDNNKTILSKDEIKILQLDDNIKEQDRRLLEEIKSYLKEINPIEKTLS